MGLNIDPTLTWQNKVALIKISKKPRAKIASLMSLFVRLVELGKFTVGFWPMIIFKCIGGHQKFIFRHFDPSKA